MQISGENKALEPQKRSWTITVVIVVGLALAPLIFAIGIGRTVQIDLRHGESALELRIQDSD